MLAGIVSQEAVPPAARVSAAGILLDRGWGKATQAHTGENGEGDIRVTIRHILEHIDEKPVIIGGAAVRCIDADTTDESKHFDAEAAQEFDGFEERCIDVDTTDEKMIPLCYPLTVTLCNTSIMSMT